MENVFITRSVYVRVADLFSKHSLIRISCLPIWVFAFQSNRAKYWFPFEQRKSKLDTCLSILCAVLIYEVYLLHSPLSIFIWYSSGVIEYQIKYALPYRAVARILFSTAGFVWGQQFFIWEKVLDYTTTIYIIIKHTYKW